MGGNDHQSSTRKWYDWYSPDQLPEERRLVLKLDLLIVPYAFILYWVKYIDQTNINNAYVSGMSEELNFNGNELVQFQTIFVVGNVLGLLPFIYLFPRVPMHYLVPTLDLGWGIFTLLQYRAQSYGEIMAYRFMVSIFEASYFPAATTYLDGHSGLPGWRRLFIINAVITLPLAFLGYFIWPGTPAKPNKLVISEHQLALARSRLERQGSVVKSVPFSWALLKRIFKNWKFYVLVLWDVFFFNTSANTAAFLLWIKSLHRYDIATMNNLSAISPALGIFFVLFINFSADLWISRAAAITLASAFNFTGLVILAVWNVPETAKWFAFSVSYSAVAVSSVLYGWANIMLKDNIEERALTLLLMTAIATSTNAGIPLFVYPTVESPRFPKGYVYSACMVVCLVTMTHIISYLFGSDGQKRSKAAQRLVEVEPETERVSAIEKDTRRTSVANSTKETGSQPKLASIPADGVPAA
ncbi:transporter SEO1 [Diaporthe eres]|uniref:Major facilitator superfamily transporter n=1 Tax=Diaporthe vaccinii TaxID=105482 RepID=A0ABR4F158_9PEZI|nr:transporter SEO1 [Diaporthe eres]